MLTKITNYIQSLIEPLGFVDRAYGLAVMVERVSDNEKFPAVYSGNELININYDQFSCLSFIMQDGKISRESLGESLIIACLFPIKETTPLKIIVYVQGSEDVDCRSRSQEIAYQIGKLFTGKHLTFASDNALQLVTMGVKSYNFDKNSVWRELYSADLSLQDADILMEIELEVSLEGDEACFVPDPCEETLTKIQTEDGIILSDQNSNQIVTS